MNRSLNVLIYFLVLLLSALLVKAAESDSLQASMNGKLENKYSTEYKRISENGIFGLNYSIGPVTDEQRVISDLKLYENGNLILTMSDVPGSDAEVSNSGYLVFYDHTHHFNGVLKIHIFDRFGSKQLSEEFDNATEFKFSNEGNLFGIRNHENLFVVDVPTQKKYSYDKCYRFDIDETSGKIASADGPQLKIYENGELISSFNTGFEIPRKVELFDDGSFAAVIDKYNLKVYDLKKEKLIFKDHLGGDFSFRDLKIEKKNLIAGIHKRTKSESAGIMRVYDLTKKSHTEIPGIRKKIINPEPVLIPQNKKTDHTPISWPFAPFDSMRTVWNHYEQHMGGYGSDFSYLHQGLDLIIPIAEPTYSVNSGIVKCVLTLGGAAYWRIAVSDSQSSGRSNGWLYAHLIENTIQFETGDTVQIHDYLGDIIDWTAEWGHIHFVEISDSGTVWFYNDNEWGINFNPLLALTPLIDPYPPVFENVFEDQLFAFCENETSNYLSPDSLYGDIDIIAKINDSIGESIWTQPAIETYYWIKSVSTDSLIKSRTLAHILNHPFEFYSSGSYEPYTAVLYKRDDQLQPTSWMAEQRNYHHILTNSNGDSLIELSEKNLAFSTTDYPDGDYIVFVEAVDPSGNSSTDSMSVKFKNGIVGIDKNIEMMPSEFILYQNYPNPFNPTTNIDFSIPNVETGHAPSLQTKLLVYDLLGRKIKTLISKPLTAGTYEVEFDASELPSGVYFYKLTAGSSTATKKMLILK